MKVKTRKSRLFIYKNCSPKGQRGVLKDEYKWRLFFFFSFLWFFFFFTGSLLQLPSSSFYSHSSLLPVVLLLARLGGYLSHQHLPLPFFDHENGLLGMQANYSAFNVAALGEESLKCRGDCYIGLCIFLYVFLRKVGEKGDPLLSKWLLLN